jgi:hypothetical protein
MNTVSQTIKSVIYMCIWILLASGGWFLWLVALHSTIDIGDYTFLIVFGLIIGILSGLSPARAFLACLCGFFIIALLVGFYFSIFDYLVLSGILCGLFAMAGAIARRILTHKRIEELRLHLWQWILLIGGVTLLADDFTIPGMFYELFVYHHIFIFVKHFIPVLIGMFLLGLYAGTFYDVAYDNLIRSVIAVSGGAHGLYLAYRVFRYFFGSIGLKSFLMIPLIGMYLLVLYEGAQIGFRLRNREFIRKSQ